MAWLVFAMQTRHWKEHGKIHIRRPSWSSQWCAGSCPVFLHNRICFRKFFCSAIPKAQSSPLNWPRNVPLTGYYCFALLQARPKICRNNRHSSCKTISIRQKVLMAGLAALYILFPAGWLKATANSCIAYATLAKPFYGTISPGSKPNGFEIFLKLILVRYSKSPPAHFGF